MPRYKYTVKIVEGVTNYYEAEVEAEDEREAKELAMEEFNCGHLECYDTSYTDSEVTDCEQGDEIEEEKVKRVGPYLANNGEEINV